jgi:dihydroflavonol-4-reductase
MTAEQGTIAVTGATGLVGSHLLPLLLKRGYRLRVLSRRPWPDSPGVTRICGDIRSNHAVRNLVRGCSAVIHLAGIAHTSLRSQSEREEAEAINVGGTRNMLAAAGDTGANRVLLVSSAHVYLGQEGVELDEQSATAGDSFYARTKLMVEQAGLEAVGAGGLGVVIARPCLVYGPGVRFNLEALMRAIRGRYCFLIRGTNPIRSFLSVHNASAGIMHLLEFGQSGRIYNLADQDPLPLVEFVNSLADLLQVSRPWKMPQCVMRAAVEGAESLQRIGLRVPINRETLRKFTVSFTLDVSRLAALGFRWPETGSATRRSMVEAYLGSYKQ